MARLVDFLEPTPEMLGVTKETKVPVMLDLSGLIHHRHEEGVGLGWFVSGCSGCQLRLKFIEAGWREGLAVRFRHDEAESSVPIPGG